MSATINLPSPLRSRLATTRWRIRLLQAVRGVAVVIVALGVFAAAVVLADSWLDLRPVIRQVLFSVGLVLGVGLSLRFVAVPQCRRIDPAALAAVIEEKYPDLGERLTSAVALADDPAEGHGSPFFIALLLDETAKRSERLDVRPAVPARRAGALAALACATVASIASPAFFWPQRYEGLTQRFLQPWVEPLAAPPFALSVSPGNEFAGRGRIVTVSAHLTPRDDKSVLPEAATLVVIESDGKATRQQMQHEASGNFTIAYKVMGEVSYRVESGGVVSDSYKITAITPVELSADSPIITVTPPAYARSVKDEETFHGLVDLAALEHSVVRLDFRFTRPAVAAHLEFLRDPKGNAVRQSLSMSEDRQAASWTISDLSDCNYRLVLEAEHDIRTELEGGSLRVQPDQPPSVRRFAGKEELRAVLPYERIPLEIEAADDIGIAGVELEYRINGEETVLRQLQLQGGGQLAIARHVLELAGKAREDDRISYRFRISDNLPKQYNGPHVVFYPPDRWLALQIARRDASLDKQQILAQRDDLNRRLQAIRNALLQEKKGVDKARQETGRSADPLVNTPDQLKQLQHQNRANERLVREAAEAAEATPALRPLGERAREVADQEMHQSQDALEQASKETLPSQRNRRLEDADKQLGSAVKRLEELIQTNNRLAQERLDRAQLEMLAQREKRLADQAAELAAKHPVLDPEAKELAEKLKSEQEETAKELERLSQESEPLKNALEQARQERARQLAERARELAQAQRNLTRAEEQTQRQRRKERLADLASQQQELARRSEKLAQEIRPVLPAARAEPLKPQESQRAADALKEGDTAEAARRQEQAANDLDRLAQRLERAVKVSADPKEAARQLEQAEKALADGVQKEIAKKDAKEPLSERLKPFAEEQKAIQRAAEHLSVPPSHAEANQTKQRISERASQAGEALRKPDPAQAQARMNDTKNLLRRLADQLPTLHDRRQKALAAVERIQREQDEIARQIEQTKKEDPSAAPRLAEAARRQDEAARALGKIDAPNQEEHRDRVAEALQRAQADLVAGRREDVPTSQQEAKRQLERLAQGLRGDKPADERARELAHKQRQLVEQAKQAAQNAATTPGRKQELRSQQQQLADQTRNIAAPEAPQRQREAAEAVQRAAQAAQAEPTSAETRNRMEEAARNLDELARQMDGEESDPARADRLARSQAEAAAETERRSGQSPTPEEQRRQREIAQEAREIHGGDEAQPQKRRALDALNHAQQAPAAERARAMRQAADALRDLADRLAGRDDPAARANNLAQQQLELARQIAGMEAGKTTPQQAKGAAERQTELARQLRRLKDRAALPQIIETRARMADAAAALAQAKSPADAKQAVARAAESSEKLAARLGQLQAARKPAVPSGRTISLKPARATTPSARLSNPKNAANSGLRILPTQEQSEQVRRLARHQRELREAVQREEQALRREKSVVRDNPVEDLTRQQAKVAEQAADLARGIGENQGEETPVGRQAKQARQATREAADKIHAGALPGAYQAGQRGAEHLRQLAEQLERTPLRLDPRATDPVRWARRLEDQQADINRRLQSVAGNPAAQTAQQLAQQRNLRRRAGELSRQLADLAHQPRITGAMQSALQRAASNSQQAQQTMNEAGQHSERGEPEAMRLSQERAAQALDRAARDASEAGPRSQSASATGGPPQSSPAQAGAAVTHAAEQMATARRQLQQGNPAQAGAAMRQAAQALGQASEQMAPGSLPRASAGKGTMPGGGRQSGGLPDLRAYGLGPSAYTGKSWGELPGELRTKIVQDMKGRYGEDYARMIKSYFEQIADTRRNDRVPR